MLAQSIDFIFSSTCTTREPLFIFPFGVLAPTWWLNNNNSNQNGLHVRISLNINYCVSCLLILCKLAHKNLAADKLTLLSCDFLPPSLGRDWLQLFGCFMWQHKQKLWYGETINSPVAVQIINNCEVNYFFLLSYNSARNLWDVHITVRYGYDYAMMILRRVATQKLEPNSWKK